MSQFTLDSVVQFIESIEYENKGKKAHKTPVFITDLNKIKDSESYFFGFLTVGSNVEKSIIKNDKDIEIITIEENSQIIIAFKNVEFLDSEDNEVIEPYGQFRGFEIILT